MKSAIKYVLFPALALALLLAATTYAQDKKQGDKDPKDWKKWSQDIREHSLEFAKAVKSKDTKAVQTAALKAVGTCNACHSKFRD